MESFEYMSQSSVRMIGEFFITDDAHNYNENKTLGKRNILNRLNASKPNRKPVMV